MRLARIGWPGAERPAASGADGIWRDLSSITDDVTPAFLATCHESGVPDLAALPVISDVSRYGPPLKGLGKIVCIGMNYRLHAAETGSPAPDEPVVFMKAADTVIGPNDDVLIPRNATKTDWEVELAVVMGAEARYLASPDDAPAAIAGYAISNDVSEREFQLERGGQWDKGKNCETFNPFGPWIATADAVSDPQNLRMSTTVNGIVRQNSTTADMIFSINHIVWYLSQFMRLCPGDVINTGTPSGVALGLPDHPYLSSGDVVEIEIEGLGRQSQQFKEA